MHHDWFTCQVASRFESQRGSQQRPCTSLRLSRAFTFCSCKIFIRMVNTVIEELTWYKHRQKNVWCISSLKWKIHGGPHIFLRFKIDHDSFCCFWLNEPRDHFNSSFFEMIRTTCTDVHTYIAVHKHVTPMALKRVGSEGQTTTHTIHTPLGIKIYKAKIDRVVPGTRVFCIVYLTEVPRRLKCKSILVNSGLPAQDVIHVALTHPPDRVIKEPHERSLTRHEQSLTPAHSDSGKSTNLNKSKRLRRTGFEPAPPKRSVP